jgi:hypothetical protein
MVTIEILIPRTDKVGNRFPPLKQKMFEDVLFEYFGDFVRGEGPFAQWFPSKPNLYGSRMFLKYTIDLQRGLIRSSSSVIGLVNLAKLYYDVDTLSVAYLGYIEVL